MHLHSSIGDFHEQINVREKSSNKSCFCLDPKVGIPRNIVDAKRCRMLIGLNICFARKNTATTIVLITNVIYRSHTFTVSLVNIGLLVDEFT